MACTITQADLGSQFAAVDPLLAEQFIAIATDNVLGYELVQAANEAAYQGCGIDPCKMIILLAQHLLSVTEGTGVNIKTVTSERVGDVAVTYGGAASNSNLFGGSPYGVLYAFQLAKFEKCQARRRTAPFAVGTTYATTKEA